MGPENFKILSLIGKGSFGEVYKVEEKKSHKKYAMKVLHKSKIFRTIFIKFIFMIFFKKKH